MKALDLGCGNDPKRFLPGADLCDVNTVLDDAFCFTNEIPDKFYDFVWYRFAWRQHFDLNIAATEVTRITRDKATVVLQDTRELYEEETEDYNYPTPKEWEDLIRKIWIPLGWSVDTLMHSEEDTLAILTKGWG